MPHIHTEPDQHDLTVSMYVIRTDFEQPKAMLHLHKKYHVWMQFGGHVELNENPWQAVKHELLEETGYDLTQLKLLQPKQRMGKITGTELHPQPININTHLAGDRHYHTSIDYAFVTDQEPAHQIAENESDQIKFVTREELEAMGAKEIFAGNQDIYRYIFDEGLPSWEQVSL